MLIQTMFDTQAVFYKCGLYTSEGVPAEFRCYFENQLLFYSFILI